MSESITSAAQAAGLRGRSARFARHADALLAATIGIGAFLLYVHTLAPGVVDADGGEFQFAAWNFSFVHPTGYPLFLILGGLFQHLLPLGNPAFRLNLFTAITAAFAVATLYLVIAKLTSSRPAAIVGAASFAVTRIFWSDANAAEVYALNAFFVACLLLLALRWKEQPTASRWAAFAFVYGLALTHHRSIILWAPAFAVFFLLVWRGTRHPVRQLFAQIFAPRSVLLFVLPLLLYLYLPLRGPASPYAVLALSSNRPLVLYDNSPSGLANYLAGRTFEYELGWDAASLARVLALPQNLISEFGFVGFAAGLFGLAAMLWRRQGQELSALLLGFAATSIFAAVYHIGDFYHYYIPAFLVWAIWIGAAVATVLPRVARVLPVHEKAMQTGCTLVALLVMPAYQLAANYTLADRSAETGAREQWSRILSFPLPQGAILVSNDRDEMMPLWYMQYVDKTRPDLLGLFPLIVPGQDYANISELTQTALGTGRPVYYVKPMPGMEIKYQLQDVGPHLARVLRSAVDQTPEFPANAVLGERLRVLGYDVAQTSNTLHIAVYWLVLARTSQDYTSFLHLTENGAKVGQADDHLVGGEYYPSSFWPVGEIVRDEHIVALSDSLRDKTLHIVVGMYQYPDGQALGDPADIGEVQVK